MQKTLFIFLACLLWVGKANAQKEANIWYFGNESVVNFSTPDGLPKATIEKDTKLNVGQKRDAFSICDDEGNLQLYTDGISVWDNQHKALATDLLGDASVVIAPHPAQKGLFYICYVGWAINPESYPTTAEAKANPTLYKELRARETVDAQIAKPSKLYYSLVDAQAKKVLEKNVLIAENVLFDCCIARHSNTTSYWLVAHEENTNNFLAYLINEAGFQKTAIKTAIGKQMPYVKLEAFAKHYFFKSSLKGDKILLNQANKADLTFEVFDFDNAVGKFKSSQEISLKMPQKPICLVGQEFSPNGAYLYTMFTEGDNPAGASSVLGMVKQYDFLQKKEVSQIGFITIGHWNMPQSIQLAPNGFIYIKRDFNNGQLFWIEKTNAPLQKENLKKAEQKTSIWYGRLPKVNHLLPLTLGGDNKVLVVGKPFTREILFETNQAILKPEYENSLQDIVAYLLKNSKTTIEISGHTDNEGEETKNKTLSENRAQALADFLIKNKVGKERIKAIGYGSAKPIADNSSPAGKAKNRRIEFLIK